MDVACTSTPASRQASITQSVSSPPPSPQRGDEQGEGRSAGAGHASRRPWSAGAGYRHHAVQADGSARCRRGRRRDRALRHPPPAQSPHPTHPSVTEATGSRRNGSGLGLTVSEGQPDSLIQEWSPVQVSSSTPKPGAYDPFAAGEFPAICGLMRRWRASLALAVGDDDLETLRPVVSASERVFTMVLTR